MTQFTYGVVTGWTSAMLGVVAALKSKRRIR